MQSWKLFSHKHRAMKTAGTEQLSPFPRTHTHPLTQAESAGTNGPENASHLNLCLRSLMSVNLHLMAFFQQRADHWACCCLSISWAHLTVIQERQDPEHSHLMFIPHGDCPATRIRLQTRFPATMKDTLRSGEQDQQARPTVSLSLRSLNFLQFPLSHIKIGKTQRNDETEKNETALVKAYSISLLMFPSPIPPTEEI